MQLEKMAIEERVNKRAPQEKLPCTRKRNICRLLSIICPVLTSMTTSDLVLFGGEELMTVRDNLSDEYHQLNGD